MESNVVTITQPDGYQTKLYPHLTEKDAAFSK